MELSLPSLPSIFKILFVVIGLGAFYLSLSKLVKKRGPTSRIQESSPSKKPARALGQWVPVDFKRPRAAPYPDWDLKATKPLPYRPFKWGTYHITMGLRSMQWDEWIELDNRYLDFHAVKAQRIVERGDRCCRTTAEAFDGACELLEELAAYLPERYPSLFRRTAVGLDNLATGESFDVVARPLCEDPMRMAARLVQDDLAIMFERADGQYYFLAGAILLPGFWRMEDKFGMPLAEIHTSGNVPGFESRLKKGMENFFRRVSPDKPVIRHNYFFQVDDNLAWSTSVGDEDGAADRDFGWFTAEKGRPIDFHMFRSERQTLRRLPRSGGVVFTIRTYFEKVVDIAQEPGIPGRLASGVRGWGQDVMKYKGFENYGDVLLNYLDEKHKEQLENGVVSDVEEHGQYPY